MSVFFSLLFSAFNVPFTAQAALYTGSLVKIDANPAVYYYALDGKRYVFPNERVFFTWYSDFSSVQTISPGELASITVGGNVTYRPGTRLVKIDTDPKVYVVSRGGILHHVTSEYIAMALFGPNWPKLVDDIPDAFFTNYMIGSAIMAASGYDRSAELSAITTISADKNLGGDSAPIQPPSQNPSPTPSLTPTPAPTCTADIWSCTDWNACTTSGNQLRNCIITNECVSVSTPSPVMTQSCTPPAPSTSSSIQTTDNLMSDPGFEVSAAGFEAQEVNDSAIRQTTSPLSGNGSLAVSIKGWGNNVWWLKDVIGTQYAKASKISASAIFRGDLVRSDSTLQFCAIAYYADSGDIQQNCTNLSKTANATTNAATTLELDSARALKTIGIRLTMDGPGPITYTMDSVSLMLTQSGAVSTVPSCTTDIWSCTNWNTCSMAGNQTRSCIVTTDCAMATTPSPATTQSCTPPSVPTPTPIASSPTQPVATAPVQLPIAGFTAVLTNSGSSLPLPLLTDAQAPSESNLTPTLKVSVPNAQCSRISNVINPSIAIPTNSNIHQIEAFWNNAALPLIDPMGADLVEEAHSYGSMIPFFKPLFSTASVPAGSGSLKINAYDANHQLVTSSVIPNLTLMKAPAPLSVNQIAAQAHPRIYLTPTRLAEIRAKSTNDLTVQRFWSETKGVGYFLNALKTNPDPTTTAFSNQVYDPESYIPALGLCYQLKKDSDTATATKCADAAKKLTMSMVNAYNSGARSFSRDSGYDIRFGLRNMMLAYDWIYEKFTPTERALIVKTSTNWVDWYTNAPGYSSKRPVQNYYAGYLQGLTLTAFATAGDNADSNRLLTLLRTKLTNEVPVINQSACGGDWPEGWNYGPYTVTEFALINQTLKDAGEDWSFNFDFIQPLARSLTYQVTTDLKTTVPFGDYSGDYAHFMRPSLLSVMSLTTDGALATRLYNNMMADPASDIHVASNRGDTFYEMIFGNTTQSSNVSGLPLSYLNTGTGRFFSKSSLTDPAGYQVTAENMSYSFDHYGFSNGDVQLFQGSTCLICSSAYRGNSFIGLGSTKDFSTYLVNGKGTVVNRNNQMLFNKETGTYSALGMRLESSWAANRFDEGMMSSAMPLDYLIREVVHVRPGILIVRDLHRRRHASDTLVGYWHLGSSQSVQTIGSGQYKVGTLNISTFTPAGITNTFSSDVDRSNTKIGTLMTQTFPSSVNQMEVVSVFSEVVTGMSYANGALKLSNGQCVTFANGDVNVASCA